MTISVRCAHCGRGIKAPDAAAGKTGKCPGCGERIAIPRNEDAMGLEVDATPVPSPDEAPVRHVTAQYVPPKEDAPVVNVNIRTEARQSSSLGIVSVICGVLAFLLCWIPFVGMLTIPVSVIGLLLGALALLLALLRRGTGIGYPIGGAVICGMALFVGFGQVAVLAGAANALAENQKANNRTKQTAARPAVVASKKTTTPAAPKAAPSEPPQEAWADASGIVKQGDIGVRITSVTVGKVSLKGFGDDVGHSEEEFTAISLEISNGNPNKKIDYHGWKGRTISPDRDYATLADNFDNSYKRCGFGINEVIGQIGMFESIYPGKSITDILIFEKPIGPNVRFLRLELPAQNFGGSGLIRIQIPASMIKPITEDQ